MSRRGGGVYPLLEQGAVIFLPSRYRACLRHTGRSPCQAERGGLSETMVELAVTEGTIVTWRTDETIPVGFGTIRVAPVWRFLLKMEAQT